MKAIRIQDTNQFFLLPGFSKLGVDVRGLDMRDVTQIWLWISVPQNIASAGTYQYGNLPPAPPRGGECTEKNSVSINSRTRWFHMQTELDGETAEDRIWVRIDIPDNLPNVDFLLVNTREINLSGYGRI